MNRLPRAGSSRLKTKTILLLTILYLMSLPLHAAGPATDPTLPVGDSKKTVQAPLFPKGMKWLNRRRPGDHVYRGKVTLVYFWDYATINCIRDREPMRALFETYHPYGFEMLTVHSPEFSFGRETSHVRRALKRSRIRFPVALDNEFELWDAFQNRSWPGKYLVNEAGVIVHEQGGEGGYRSMEEAIRREIREINPSAVLPEFLFSQDEDRFNIWECGEMSGEVYLGHKRASWWGIEIANRTGIVANETILYKDRGERKDRSFFLQGQWTNREEFFEHARENDAFTDYLGIMYVAHEVYLVADNPRHRKPARIIVKRDELPVPEFLRGRDLREDEDGETYFLLDEPRLYYLIAGEMPGFHELKLYVQSEGVTFYAFSFSNHCLAAFDHR